MRDASGMQGNTFGHCLRGAAALFLLSSFAACSDSNSTGVDGGSNQLSFAAGSAGAIADSSGDSTHTGLVPVTMNGHTLDLSQITVSVDRAELKRSHDDVCHNDDGGYGSNSAASDSTSRHGQGNCAVVKVGGAVVDLPTTGAVVTVPADSFPSGTYRELEVRVSEVHIKGTFDSTAFDVTLPLNVKSDAAFATPLVVVDGTPTSITVDLPVVDWLTDLGGSLIDPSRILTTPTLLAQLKIRIGASIQAFQDSDHDNRPDGN